MLTYATVPKRRSDYAHISSFETLAPLVSINPPKAIFVGSEFWTKIATSPKDSMFFQYVNLESDIDVVRNGVVGSMSRVPIITDSFSHPDERVKWMSSCDDGFYVTYTERSKSLPSV